MKERWVDAVWLGKRRTSDEHICLLPDGTVEYSRSIRIREEADKWNWDLVNLIRGVPWNVKGEGSVDEHTIPESIPFKQKEKDDAIRAEAKSDPDPIPRGFQITTEMIEKFGYTVGCRRCRAMQVSDPEVSSKRHSEACRLRIRSALDNDSNLKTKAERAEARGEAYKRKVSVPEVVPIVQKSSGSSGLSDEKRAEGVSDQNKKDLDEGIKRSKREEPAPISRAGSKVTPEPKRARTVTVAVEEDEVLDAPPPYGK